MARAKRSNNNGSLCGVQNGSAKILSTCSVTDKKLSFILNGSYKVLLITEGPGILIFLIDFAMIDEDFHFPNTRKP